MEASRQLRPLSVEERAYLQLHKWLGLGVQSFAVQIDGPVTGEVMGQALARVAARHQVLRLCVHTDASGNLCFFELDPSDTPQLTVVGEAGRDDWRSALHRGAGGDGPVFHDFVGAPRLWSATLYLSGNPAVLVLETCHAIVDGKSRVAIVHEVLRCLSEVAAGQPADNAGGSTLYPPTDEHFTAERFGLVPPKTHPLVRFLGAAIGERRAGAGMQLERGGPLRERVILATAPPEALARFRGACREHGVSVSSGLFAAVICAATEAEVLFPESKTTLESAVSLRRFWRPEPVPEAAVGMFICSVVDHATAKRRDALWEVADQVQTGVFSRDTILERGIAHMEVTYGAIDAAMRWVPRLCRWLFGGRDPVILLTNIGEIPFPKDYGPFRWGRSFVVQSQGAYGYPLAMYVASHGGELYFTLTHTTPLIPEERGDRIAEELCRILGAQLVINRETHTGWGS